MPYSFLYGIIGQQVQDYNKLCRASRTRTIRIIKASDLGLQL
jgi:hypothetical protein